MAARELDRLAAAASPRSSSAGDFTGKPGDTLLVGDLGAGAPPRDSSLDWAARRINRPVAAACADRGLQAITRTGARHANCASAAEPVKGLDAYARGRLAPSRRRLALYRIPDLKTAPKPHCRRSQA